MWKALEKRQRRWLRRGGLVPSSGKKPEPTVGKLREGKRRGDKKGKTKRDESSA